MSETNIKELIDRYDRVTILSHKNPDGGTIGTALGIYTILKNHGKSVEVVNIGEKLPKYLDFLPNFSKIKREINYDNSLVICCDAGSIDLDGRDILNIDHYKGNITSTSQVAFELFRENFPIMREVATCFYTGLVSDTQYFRTNSVTKEVFDVASDMIAYGIDISVVAYNLNQRQSLTSLRILGSALDSLELHCDARLATMVITKERIREAGADDLDLLDVITHGISLATVEMAVVLVELDSSIRVSIQSKEIDLSPLFIYFGGGRDRNTGGFEIKRESVNMFLQEIIKKIKGMELL